MKLQTKLDSLGKVKQTETSNCCTCLLLFLFNCLAVAGVIEMEVDSRDTEWTPGAHLLCAAWCVILRMSDVVAEFSTKGEWRHDLINKWKEAFQALVAVGEGLPLQVTKYHPGINL